MSDEYAAYMGWGISAQEQIDGFRREVRELKAENAKLRKENASLLTMRDTWAENDAKLRELVDGLRYCAHESYGMCARVPVGGERPFTCCPLYDFDSKEYRCETLMRELGMGVYDE